MNRNILYVIIGALAVVGVILIYQIYQERQDDTNIEIKVGEGGVSIQKD
jgi:hypothetical protein